MCLYESVFFLSNLRAHSGLKFLYLVVPLLLFRSMYTLLRSLK